MTMMKDEPQTLEGAYQKALSELKWKIQLNARAEYEDEPMEICHSKRQTLIKAVSPAKFKRVNI